MNKSDLIDAMAADAGISKVAAKAALESFTDNVTATLKGGIENLLKQHLPEVKEVVAFNG